MHDIIIIKLSTGETIIAKIFEVAGVADTVFVETPMQIVEYMDSMNVRTIGLMPFMPYVQDHQFPIPKHTMAICAIPTSELLNDYKTMIGDIIVPSSSIIV